MARCIFNGKMYWANHVGVASKAGAKRIAKRYPRGTTKITFENGKLVGGVSLGNSKYPYVVWVSTAGSVEKAKKGITKSRRSKKKK